MPQHINRAVSTAAIRFAIRRHGLVGALSASVALLAISVTSCSGGSANDDAARMAAVQAMLDARPAFGRVQTGRLCGRPDDFAKVERRNDPHAYEHVPGVHVVPNGKQARVGVVWGATEPCFLVSWDASTGIKNPPEGYLLDARVKIGRFIVDKLRDEQDTAGVKVTPFKAHFEPNELGKPLIVARIVEKPADVTDAQAVLHKDADGKWVAQ